MGTRGLCRLPFAFSAPGWHSANTCALNSSTGFCAALFLLARTHAHRTVFHLLRAHNEHVGDLLQLGFADLVSHLLGAVVALHTQPCVPQLLLHLFGIGMVRLADGDDLHLHRRQPRRGMRPQSAR